MLGGFDLSSRRTLRGCRRVCRGRVSCDLETNDGVGVHTESERNNGDCITAEANASRSDLFPSSFAAPLDEI